MFDLPYPKSRSKREVLVSSVLAGLSAYLFLLIFQPFGTHTISNSKLPGILFPYFVIAFLSFYGINLLSFKKTKEWNWEKEIFQTSLIVFLCSIAGYFYNTLFISRVPLNFLNFAYMVGYTFSIAIPICSVYLLTRFLYLNTQPNPALAFKTITSQDTYPSRITLNGFSIYESDLYFVESTDNYCTFCYLDNTEIKKTLIRTTLKSTLEQIHSPKILRCHRSYIVNLSRAENLKTNAQGCKLQLKTTALEVPVSRKYKDAVSRILNS